MLYKLNEKNRQNDGRLAIRVTFGGLSRFEEGTMAHRRAEN